ncbi:MAG: nucleotidyltransferase domain-containing protein [Syntrophobacteria bacterium]
MDLIIKTLSALAVKYQISAIYAFGSRAREVTAWIHGDTVDREHMKSDVDIGILPRPESVLSVKDKVQLGIHIEDLLEVAKVDLVFLPGADPFVAANIIRGERLYCADEYQVDEYELYVLRRAGDLIPLEKERISLILGES